MSHSVLMNAENANPEFQKVVYAAKTTSPANLQAVVNKIVSFEGIENVGKEAVVAALVQTASNQKNSFCDGDRSAILNALEALEAKEAIKSVNYLCENRPSAGV